MLIALSRGSMSANHRRFLLKVNRPPLFFSQVASIAMDYKKEFSKRLMGLDELRKLPERKRVPKLCALTGRKQPSVRAWTIGESIPDYPDLLKILKWGKTTSDYLLFGIGPRTASAGLATANHMEDQLLTFFRGLDGDEEAQGFVLSAANREYNKKHPEDRKADPFGDGAAAAIKVVHPEKSKAKK